MERLAREIGVNVINNQIAEIEIEQLKEDKKLSDLIIDGFKNKLLEQEVSLHELREEIFDLRLKLSIPTRKPMKSQKLIAHEKSTEKE